MKNLETSGKTGRVGRSGLVHCASVNYVHPHPILKICPLPGILVSKDVKDYSKCK